MENKKRNKKIGLAIIILLILILTLLIIYLILINNRNEKKNLIDDKNKLFIVEQKTFNNYQFIDTFNDYILIIKDNKLKAITKNGNEKEDFSYNKDADIYVMHNGLYLTSDNINYLFDQNLNLVVSSSEEITYVEDLANSDIYYVYNDNLYNLKKELIYQKVPLYFEKVGNYILTDESLINIDNNEKTPIKYYISSFDYIYALSPNEKDLYIYDLKTNTFNNYEIITNNYNGFYLKDSANNEYTFTTSENLIGKEIIKVKNYEFNYQECSYGFKVYDKNKLLSDVCFETYTENKNSSIITLTKKEKNYLLYNDKITENNSDDYVVGKYIVKYNFYLGNISLSTIDGQKVNDNPCPYTIDIIENNKYLCSNRGSTYLVNENLEKETPSYESIYCIDNSNYCIFEENNKYGLLEDNNILIPAIYENIDTNLDNNQIIAEDLWHFDIFYLKNSSVHLKKSDLNLNFNKPYEDINTNDIINKYNLSFMKEVINENEEFFKKYTYIALNNSSIDNYINQVMKLFYEVGLNKDLITEDYLLASLKDLKIIRNDSILEEGYAGLYHDNEKKIEISTDEDSTLYHELTHFVDHSTSPYNSDTIYVCNDKFVSNYEYNRLNIHEASNCEIAITREPNFLIEGGAEYFSGTYLNNNIIRTYRIPTCIIGALAYIYGFDTINEIYFDGVNGSLKLFKLFYDSNITVLDYENFLEITSRLYTLKDRDYFTISDILINLYENKTNEPWYENKEFKEIITMLTSYITIKEEYTDRYDEYLKLDYDFYNKYDKLIDITEKSVMTPGNYLKNNEGSYLIISFVDKNNILYYNIIKYDFINDKVLDIKVIKSNS